MDKTDSKTMNIPRELFEPAHEGKKIHDEKLNTKPIGYFKDAWIRFKKNKASFVALIIIVLIALFAIIAPFCTSYKISDCDGYYSKTRPCISLFQGSGSGVWDGTYKRTENYKGLVFYSAIGIGALDTEGTGDIAWNRADDSDLSAIQKYIKEYDETSLVGTTEKTTTFFELLVDSYMQVGFVYKESITTEEIARIKAWEQETGKQILYPIVDETNSAKFDLYNKGTADAANYWYAHNSRNEPIDEYGNVMTLDQIRENGLTANYKKDKVTGEVLFYEPTGASGTTYRIRVLYYNYYQYINDGKTPLHAFGADSQGYDILVRLACGCRLSLILAVCVSLINLTIGAIYGMIEGYYGGWTDMIMERVSDILSGVPFIIMATLFKLKFVDTGMVSMLGGLLFAFVVTGWIGTAYRVRVQFYRFKRQEYILAARTLGAKDARLMLKHILPNALGTIITSSVLVIPSVIFSETSLAYLGIINFNGQYITSLGTMLANGQSAGIGNYPHIIFFPAIILSLLMISFNLFGNGLRDAFNPSLRGVEE